MSGLGNWMIVCGVGVLISGLENKNSILQLLLLSIGFTLRLFSFSKSEFRHREGVESLLLLFCLTASEWITSASLRLFIMTLFIVYLAPMSLVALNQSTDRFLKNPGVVRAFWLVHDLYYWGVFGVGVPHYIFISTFY